MKQITVRQKVGTVKVRSGKGKKKKLVTKPKYANVKKNIQLVDLAKKAKKESYDRLATERLKDLLQIKETALQVRLETLDALIEAAEAKHQDAYLQQLVPEVEDAHVPEHLALVREERGVAAGAGHQRLDVVGHLPVQEGLGLGARQCELAAAGAIDDERVH